MVFAGTLATLARGLQVGRGLFVLSTPILQGSNKRMLLLKGPAQFLVGDFLEDFYFYCTYSMAGLTFMTCSERQRNQRSASQTTLKILDEKVLPKKNTQLTTRRFREQRTTLSTVVEIASNQNRRPSKHLQT